MDQMSDVFRRNYDGTNPRLPTQPYCQHCLFDLDESKILLCGQCLMVHYCSRKCQKADFRSSHKAFCQNIKQLQDKVEREAEKLRHYRGFMFGSGARPENLFETNPGDFWGIFETRNYMRERSSLVDATMEFMNEQMRDNSLMLAAAEGHASELLRLSQSDNLGVRYYYPFLLLRMNQDDRAYAFCRRWLLEDYNSESDRPREYPCEPDCRLNDIFAEVESREDAIKDADLAFLVAMLVIKARIVAVLEATKLREGANFGSERQLQEQMRIRTRLMDVIQNHNCSMLPALLNPRPLLTQPNPGYYSHGRPTEAYMVLKEAYILWCTIPGTKELLVQKFGSETPSYPSQLE
jgi:hypothetical protein